MILTRRNKRVYKTLKKIRNFDANEVRQYIIRKFGQYEFDNMLHQHIDVMKYTVPCIATLLFGIYLFIDNWEILYKSHIQTNVMFEAYVAAYSFLLWNVMYFLFDYTDLVKYKYNASSDPNSINYVNNEWDDVLNAWFTLPIYLLSIEVYHVFKTKPVFSDYSELPSLPRFLIELSSGIVMYDFIFWWIHVAMHKIPFLYDNIHKTHHTHKQLTACNTVIHSMVDAGLQVGVNILVQNISPFGHKHILSRICHNALITYMLTEIHANYNLPWALHNLVPSVFGGSLRHRYHHAYTQPNFKGRRGVFYHEFFKYMDHICGFEVSDETCMNV
jgi:sterol desaturase/sphingolipid hydroxylase (fatty acid hydroxylase superfamily)